MAAGTAEGPQDEAPLSIVPRIRRGLWRLTTATVGACFRYRVTGLAAEAAFFAILSLPPLVFGLAGTIGYVADRYDVTTVQGIRDDVLDLAAQALTPDTVDDVIRPTLDDVLAGGRADVISVGFVLALWSGSRALNVFIDTITIMYGLGGRRGIVKTRALSFALYGVALVVGVVVLPLILAGPDLIDSVLPPRLDFVMTLYTPAVFVLTIVFLTTLYHLAVPVRTSWLYNVPGAVFTLLVWIVGSWALRWVLTEAIGSTSIFGPLAAPIAVLIWLYVLSIAVLIGAAVNASFDRLFPARSTAHARLELVRKLRQRKEEARLRDAGLTGDTVDELDASLMADDLEESTERVMENARRARRLGNRPPGRRDKPDADAG